MQIDSLTVTSLVVFIIMFAVFVRFCMVKVCTLAAMRRYGLSEDRDAGESQAGKGTEGAS